MKTKTEHTRSGGNVFADLELPDADERMLKAQLSVQIRNSLMLACLLHLYRSVSILLHNITIVLRV